MVGLITGIAASLSMGSTSYLASKTEKTAGRDKIRPLYGNSLYFYGYSPDFALPVTIECINRAGGYDCKCNNRSVDI
jgi:hypothetical protein